MEIELKQIKVQTAKKTYTYLAVILPKVLMENLKPIQVIINVEPPIELAINERFDGRGYAILPTKITDYFAFVKGQKVEITLTLKK